MSIRCGTLVAFTLAVFCKPAFATQEWGPIQVRDHRIAPGTKEKFYTIPVRSFEGAYLDVNVTVARGKQAGPTLCIVAGIHGDELNGAEIARRAAAATDPQRLAGTLIAIPAVNSLGLRTGNRYMADRRDLNRSFPGNRGGSAASIVADRVFADIIRPHCNALIDLHTGSFHRTNVPQIRVDLSNAKALDLARHFGIGIVLGGAGPRGSLRREAMEAGIPAIIYEAGEPHRFQVEEIERGVEGIFNVMAFLELIPQRKTDAALSTVYRRTTWVRVPIGKGGVFFPSLALGAEVQKGDVLGTVMSPDTDELFEVRAPRNGALIGMAVPQIVLSGYGLFHLGFNDKEAEQAATHEQIRPSAP